MRWRSVTAVNRIDESIGQTSFQSSWEVMIVSTIVVVDPMGLSFLIWSPGTPLRSFDLPCCPVYVSLVVNPGLCDGIKVKSKGRPNRSSSHDLMSTTAESQFGGHDPRLDEAAVSARDKLGLWPRYSKIVVVLMVCLVGRDLNKPSLVWR